MIFPRTYVKGVVIMIDVAIADREKLMGAFQRQAAGLVRKGYDILAGGRRKEFSKSLDRLVKLLGRNSSTNGIRIHKGNIPCLIIIPNSMIPLPLRMRYKKWKTDNCLYPGEVESDVVKYYSPPPFLPKSLYLIFDVECGKHWEGDIEKAQMDLQRLNRRGLVPEEGIAMIEYDESVINHHPFFLIGGGRRKDGSTPALIKYQSVDLYYSKGAVNYHFGIPSCSQNIIIS